MTKCSRLLSYGELLEAPQTDSASICTAYFFSALGAHSTFTLAVHEGRAGEENPSGHLRRSFDLISGQVQVNRAGSGSDDVIQRDENDTMLEPVNPNADVCYDRQLLVGLGAVCHITGLVKMRVLPPPPIWYGVLMPAGFHATGEAAFSVACSRIVL